MTTQQPPKANKTAWWRKTVFAVAIVFILGGLYILYDGFTGGYEGNGRIAVFLSAGILVIPPGILAFFQVLMWAMPDKYREVTNREALGELAVSALGLVFVVPFIFYSTNGEVLSRESSWEAAGLALLSIAFPAIRPRKNSVEPKPLSKDFIAEKQEQ
ncbi:hypothetical protein [Glutamicibacter ardleyensis]|uniref:hypothetical protein n=1 Tax=Glutamicibacter ardleyensis TaxID=225894 RepID=UPI003FD4C1F6